VERAVAGWRQDLRAERLSTVRFETPPGQQLQVDFGAATVMIGAERVKVHLFVATLGYSRRHFVAIFRHERQSAWLEGLERAFQHFAGVPEEVLLDNAKPLVVHHDIATREVVLNGRFRAFAGYWGFRPHACAPYRACDLRARTSGRWATSSAMRSKATEFASWEAQESAPCLVDARSGRCAGAWHPWRTAAAALCADGGRGATAAQWAATLSADTGGGASGAQ
jgi:integrase-like protein